MQEIRWGAGRGGEAGRGGYKSRNDPNYAYGGSMVVYYSVNIVDTIFISKQLVEN